MRTVEEEPDSEEEEEREEQAKVDEETKELTQVYLLVDTRFYGSLRCIDR